MENYKLNLETQKIKPKKSTLIMPHEKPLAQIIILTVIIVCLLFSFLPLFLTIVNALKLDDQVASNAFALPDVAHIGEAIVKNFSAAWDAIGKYYFKTILVALIGAVAETIVGATLAYILSFKDFYFKDFVFMLFISVLLVPSIIGYPILVPLVRDTFGLGDNYLGYLIAMVGGAQVSGMFLFKTFFSQQPKSLYESAQLDGANDFVILTKITVPLALPIILYYFVGCFSGIYNEYLWASLILDNNQTLTNIMYAVVDSGAIKYGSMYAMYIISSIPLIITVIISMKYFKSGEFAAGLKL
ncbi:MAG: carbohydrate ABC transporter permease [Clostridia bacterium]|nr:carbohydrate ABC transporter permease [Clostridia bacterium]